MAQIKVEWEVNLWKKKLRVLKRLGLSTGLEPQKVLQGDFKWEVHARKQK